MYHDFKYNVHYPKIYQIIANTAVYIPSQVWLPICLGCFNFYIWWPTYGVCFLCVYSPVKDYILTNDRWGSDCFCKHGGVWTCSDRFHPGTYQLKQQCLLLMTFGLDKQIFLLCLHVTYPAYIHNMMHMQKVWQLNFNYFIQININYFIGYFF